jgi:hypothetical protein
LAGLLVLWLLEGALETSLLGFLAGWVFSIVLIDVILPVAASRAAGWMAAGIGLLIHLTGAGGIAMPAITQLLFLVALLAVDDISGVEGRVLPKWAHVMTLAGGLGLLGACFWTAAQPVAEVQALVARASYAKLPSQREQLFRQATLADPWAPQPWEQLSEVLYAKWRSSPHPDDADYRLAVAAQQSAVARDPLSFHTHRTLGMIYNAGAVKSGRRADHEAAVWELQITVQRYPHNAEVLADAAQVFAAAGDAGLASRTARAALVQDDINHAAGHTDKWLTEPVRQQLQQFAAKPN